MYKSKCVQKIAHSLRSIKFEIGNNDSIFTYKRSVLYCSLSHSIYMSFFIFIPFFIFKVERSGILSLFLRQLKQHTQCIINLGKTFRFGNLNRNLYLFVLKCWLSVRVEQRDVYDNTIFIYINGFHTHFTKQVHSFCKLHEFILYSNTYIMYNINDREIMCFD